MATSEFKPCLEKRKKILRDKARKFINEFPCWFSEGGETDVGIPDLYREHRVLVDEYNNLGR